MKWQRLKGIRIDETCPRCHGTFDSDDYDYEEDMCIYCLFPEAQKSMAVEMDYSEGRPKNRTFEGQLIDNIQFTPEKQSKQAEESKLNYDYKKKKRNLYK